MLLLAGNYEEEYQVRFSGYFAVSFVVNFSVLFWHSLNIQW